MTDVESLATGVNADLRLDCVACAGLTEPVRHADDRASVVRCGACGQRHNRDSLRVAVGGGG
jgi:hypothetical protein